MARYIDADALKSRLEGWPSDFYDYDELIPLIDEQPTISPDEVRGEGKWIEERMDYKCTACGKTVKDEIVYMLDPYQQPPFCPNCGVKMEVE